MKKQPIPRKTKASTPPPAKSLKPAAKLRKTTASKRASSPSRSRNAQQVDDAARRAMIAQAAYFRAEKRGFDVSGELDDWLQAEREISHMLDE